MDTLESILYSAPSAQNIVGRRGRGKAGVTERSESPSCSLCATYICGDYK